MSRSSIVLAASLVTGLFLATVPTDASETPSELDATSDETLELSAVLASVNAHFPLLLAAEFERDAKLAELGAAFGDFDTRLQSDGEVRPAGFYESYGGGIGVEQRTRLWGTRMNTSYRYGGGDFPSYEGGRLTDEAGEIRAGLTLPLLRGGAIDASRARIQRAEIAVERTEPEIQLQQIRSLRDATLAYWDWVAAGQRRDVDARLLEVSASRQSQIARRVERGAEARIDLVDNERLIVDRRVRLRAAQRDLDQAAIHLSLFFRDDAGRPRSIHAEQIPAAFPNEIPPNPEQFATDIDYARRHHPIVRQLILDRERLEVDARLASNDALPGLDLGVRVSQDFGTATPGIDTSGKLSSRPRSETEVMASIRIEFPVQRRAAKGQLALARARMSQLEHRARFESDRIVAQVRSAVAGLEAAFDQTGQARRNFSLAEELRIAEERKLSLGLSNLIDVNIREVQAAAAARGLIDAQAAYFRALADYEAAIARPERPLADREPLSDRSPRADGGRSRS